MKELIKDALESAWADGKDIDDWSRIPDDLRPEIIRTWLDTAEYIDMEDVFISGSNWPDQYRTIFLFACGMDSDAVRVHLLHRIWEGMAWRIDQAIDEVRAEHELTALIAREERAEQQAEWQRDRFADAKEYQA